MSAYVSTLEDCWLLICGLGAKHLLALVVIVGYLLLGWFFCGWVPPYSTTCLWLLVVYASNNAFVVVAWSAKC